MDWSMVTAIGTLLSGLVFLAGVMIAVQELDHMARDRYVTITNTLLQIWESPEFQKAQLWILYELDTTEWDKFVETQGGKFGEQAIITVGSFYNQIGTLTREHLIPSPHALLHSVGGYAIAVWEKIRPLVEQARRQEISELFSNYEWLVAAAYQAYKPDHPLSRDQQFLGELERLAGTVGAEERPGLRFLRRWRRRARGRRSEASSHSPTEPRSPDERNALPGGEAERAPEPRPR